MSKLIVGVDMKSFEDVGLYLLSNNMTIDFNVLGALMIDWICYNVKSSLIVTKEKCRTIMSVSNLSTEQVARQVHKLCLSYTDILPWRMNEIQFVSFWISRK